MTSFCKWLNYSRFLAARAAYQWHVFSSVWIWDFSLRYQWHVFTSIWIWDFSLRSKWQSRRRKSGRKGRARSARPFLPKSTRERCHFDQNTQRSVVLTGEIYSFVITLWGLFFRGLVLEMTRLAPPLTTPYRLSLVLENLRSKFEGRNLKIATWWLKSHYRILQPRINLPSQTTLSKGIE